MDAPLGGPKSVTYDSEAPLTQRPRIDIAAPPACQPETLKSKLWTFRQAGLCLGCVAIVAAGIFVFSGESSYQVPPKPPLSNSENRSVYFGYG